MEYDDLRRGDIVASDLHPDEPVTLSHRRTATGASGNRYAFWQGLDASGTVFEVSRARFDRGEWRFVSRPVRTVKVTRTFTFTVDVDAWAREYGTDATASAVREDFGMSLDQFAEPESFSSAWPGLVTKVESR